MFKEKIDLMENIFKREFDVKVVKDRTFECIANLMQKDISLNGGPILNRTQNLQLKWEIDTKQAAKSHFRMENDTKLDTQKNLILNGV